MPCCDLPVVVEIWYQHFPAPNSFIASFANSNTRQPVPYSVVSYRDDRPSCVPVPCPLSPFRPCSSPPPLSPGALLRQRGEPGFLPPRPHFDSDRTTRVERPYFTEEPCPYYDGTFRDAAGRCPGEAGFLPPALEGQVSVPMWARAPRAAAFWGALGRCWCRCLAPLLLRGVWGSAGAGEPENCSAGGGGGGTWTPTEGGGGGWRNGVPCRALCFV